MPKFESFNARKLQKFPYRHFPSYQIDSSFSVGQKDVRVQLDQPLVRYGISTGLQAANMNFNKGYPPLAIPAEAAWKVGLASGAFIQVRLSDKFFFQQAYLFSLVRGADRSSHAHYTFNYFSLPVLFKYAFSPSFSLVGGPQFELLLQGKRRVNGQADNVTHATEERSFGLTGGVEYRLNERIGLYARFMQGLNHIGIGQRSATKEFKFEIIQFYIGFLL